MLSTLYKYFESRAKILDEFLIFDLTQKVLKIYCSADIYKQNLEAISKNNKIRFFFAKEFHYDKEFLKNLIKPIVINDFDGQIPEESLEKYLENIIYLAKYISNYLHHVNAINHIYKSGKTFKCHSYIIFRNNVIDNIFSGAASVENLNKYSAEAKDLIYNYILKIDSEPEFKCEKFNEEIIKQKEKDEENNLEEIFSLLDDDLSK